MRWMISWVGEPSPDPTSSGGRTENVVRIQINAAIYCLVAIVQHDMRLEHSTYEALQILSILLTDKNLFMFYIFFLIILKIFMVSSGFLALK